MNDIQFDLFHYETVTSTNETALELLKGSKAVLPFGVRAAVQTKGTGTRGRKWVSPQGNLYVTYCLENKTLQDVSAFSLVTSCCILQVFKNLGYDFDLKVKWPNDIYCHDKKIGGILITKTQYQDYSVLSIGIGLNFRNAPIIDDPSYQSGALKDYYNDLPPLNSFVQYLGNHLHKSFLKFQKDGFKGNQDYWNAHAYLKNSKVIFQQDNGKKITGIFEGVSDKGAVIISTDGKEYYYSGKIRAGQS